MYGKSSTLANRQDVLQLVFAALCPLDFSLEHLLDRYEALP